MVYGDGRRPRFTVIVNIEKEILVSKPYLLKKDYFVSMKQSSPGGNLPKLAQPAVRALNGAGVRTLEALQNLTEKELAGLHGIGPNALKQLKQAMEAKGITFKKDL